MLKIGTSQIPRGVFQMVKLPIGRLPSGNQISINTHVFRSREPGPILLLIGGLHGDEINGVEILRRSLEMKLFSNLKMGSVIVIPILNMFGFINFSREVQDGKDVNRSFPGSLSGSMASRVARSLTKNILPNVTMGIDFHTGGSSRFNYPQIRFSSKHASSVKLAEVFNAPFNVIKPTIPKSFRRIGQDMGIPIIVYEGGESLRFDNHSIETGIRGIKRILNHFEMDNFLTDPLETVTLRKSTWLRSAVPGLFTPVISNGNKISKGQLLGWIHDPMNQNNQTIISKYDGYCFCINNMPVIYPGDPLFNIGMT